MGRKPGDTSSCVSHEHSSQGKGAGGGSLEAQAEKIFHRCLRYLKLFLFVFWIPRPQPLTPDLDTGEWGE